MNNTLRNNCRAILIGFLLSSAASAQAHPGSAVHYHPEVDEFDKTSMTSQIGSQKHSDLGGTLVLTGIAACLAFAFFQKESGIWKDATANH